MAAGGKRNDTSKRSVNGKQTMATDEPSDESLDDEPIENEEVLHESFHRKRRLQQQTANDYGKVLKFGEVQVLYSSPEPISIFGVCPPPPPPPLFPDRLFFFSTKTSSNSNRLQFQQPNRPTAQRRTGQTGGPKPETVANRFYECKSKLREAGQAALY